MQQADRQGVEQQADRIAGTWPDLAHGGIAGDGQQVPQEGVAQDVLDVCRQRRLLCQAHDLQES